MADWRLILTDNGFTPLGEILNAKERKVSLPLSKFSTASFSVRLDNPLADYMSGSRGYLKAYRNGVLVHYGPLISAEESGDISGATLAVNSVSSGWVLQKRLVGKSQFGTSLGLTDRAQIVKSQIDTTNTDNETHIATDGAMSAASATSYVVGPYKPLMDIVTDLSASQDGFDWRIVPLDNYSAGAVTSTKIGRFEAYPLIGIFQSEAIFEWGTGRNNIASYKRTMTRDGQANKVYHFTSKGPDDPTYPTISALNSASITDWGLLEDLAQADLLDVTLRTKLVNEHVAVRGLPRQVIEFTPHIEDKSGRMPRFGIDYGVGDFVTARAVYNRTTRFNGTFRVWGVNFDINDLGTETAGLVLSQEGS